MESRAASTSKSREHGRGVSIETDASGGVRMDFGVARHPGLALEYTLFAAAFVATPLVLHYRYHVGLGMVIPFALFLGLIALVIGITAWGMWFSFCHLTARMKTLELRRGQLFFSRTLRFDAADITKARIERTQETEHATWYCLEIHTTQPRHKIVVIADGLLKHDADQCLALLIKALDLPPHPKRTHAPEDRQI